MSKEVATKEKKKPSSKKDADKSQGSVKSKKVKDTALMSNIEPQNHDHEKHEKDIP